jgi:ABC-type transport system involved in cytochrome bd biosynthesis fused ATPase/permease subunit
MARTPENSSVRTPDDPCSVDIEAGFLTRSCSPSSASFFSIFNALFATVNLLPHLLTLSEAIQAQGRIKAEIERLSSIDPRSEEGLTTFQVNASEKVDGIGRQIEVRNVTFEFPSRPGKKALDDVSLIIERGKVTALVGRASSFFAQLLLSVRAPC